MNSRIVFSPSRRFIITFCFAVSVGLLTSLAASFAGERSTRPSAAFVELDALAQNDDAKPTEKSAKKSEKDAKDDSTEAKRENKTRKKDDKPAKIVAENPFPNRIPAPSLDGGQDWLNVGGEITLDDLKGKVVLLDFWTFCCINCMHVLPDLAYLEEKYANELVVIGVHSAKFENEKDSENIKKAILRYEIKHPVINDSQMTIWRKFDVNSWPTFVLIDPEGFYCGAQPGEGNREILDLVIGKVVDYHKAKGTLDETPVHFDLEAHRQEPRPLRFPGKVLADPEGKRLFVVDSGHHRIIVTDGEGQLLDIIGSGALGRADGDYATASFDHPQGIEIVGDTLYVADTENHLLRQVDLTAKTVSTLAGTGVQGHFQDVEGGPLQKTALNSPWDLRHVDGTLYIAMAGPHQIWKHKIGSVRIVAFAGTGREDILNGTLERSAFAQPSAIVTDGKQLFVADSEGSSIRQIGIKSGKVTTVAGASDLPNNRTLFEFGDRDGKSDLARLQHPLGLALKGSTLYVADSYNHKIKQVDLENQVVKSWLGTGEAGDVLDPVQFSEPGGLTIWGDDLIIADTNNHRLCKANLESGEVTVFEIAGLEPPAPPSTETEVESVSAPEVMEVKKQTLAAGESIKFQINVTLPDEFKLNPQAPVTYQLKPMEDQTLFADDQLNARKRGKIQEGVIEFEVPVANGSGAGKFLVQISYGYCRDGKGGLCKLNTTRWLVPIEIDPNSEQSAVELESIAEK
ncbi:MAG: thioredoxin-like domain-containing protein [Planctomycetaceae bacterium]